MVFLVPVVIAGFDNRDNDNYDYDYQNENENTEIISKSYSTGCFTSTDTSNIEITCKLLVLIT